MMAGVAGLHPDKYNSMCGDINNALSTFMPDSTGASSSKTRMKMVIPGDVSREVAQAVEGVVSGGGAAGMGGLASLANAGVNGDSMVAHMSPDQFASLGTDNPMNALTGLPQAFADDGMSGNPDDPDDVSAPSPSMTGDTSSMGPSTVGESPDRGIGQGFGGPQGLGGPGPAPADPQGWGGPTAPDPYSGMSIGEINQAKSYGFNMTSLRDLAEKTGKSLEDIVDLAIEGRHSQNPSPQALAVADYTEVGFQQANPGMTSFVKGIAGLTSVGTFGKVVNATKGLTQMPEDIVGAIMGTNTPNQPTVQEIADRINESTAADVAAGVVGTTVGVETSEDEPSSFEEEGGIDPSTGEADPKAQDMGYTGAEMKIIADNYGTVSDFEAAFRREFGRDIVPADMLEQEVLTFLNMPAKSTKQAPTPMST